MKYTISLVLALGALLSACVVDPKPTCTPTNCTGCCDSTGQCQLGASQSACGAAGNACDVCISSQICQLGRCFTQSTGGGTGAGGGGGGGGSTPTCNTTGIAPGCSATLAFACPASAQCYATFANCQSAPACGGTGGGAGGGTGGGMVGGGAGGGAMGGGGGGSPLTCNTTGTFPGCGASTPFSCDLAVSCFPTLVACVNSSECGGTDAGMGGGAGGGTGGGGAVGGGAGGGGAGPRTLTGRATYDSVPARYQSGAGGSLYFNQTVARPIRSAVVRVVEGTTVLTTGATALDGTYSLSFTAGTGALQVQVLARTNTPFIQVEDNTAQNATWAFGTAIPNGATTLNVHATHGWTGSSYGPNRRAAPFAILDSMYTAATAFTAVRPVTFPSLKVNWSPNNSTQDGNTALGQISTSHFSPQENEIYLLGQAGADTDEFDTHVCVHEWGHYFEENVSRSDSPGGPHGGGDVLDPRIAFGEAWGTAVAAMVLPETMYTDSAWSGGTLFAWGYDAEYIPNPTDAPTPNAFSENSVLRAIYDLYDTSVDGPHDQVGVGLGTVYDVVAGPQRTTDALTTLASFTTGLKARPGANTPGINAVLARYSVGPITSDFGAGDTALSGIFRSAALPFSGTIALTGGLPSNSYLQNQYFVFTGTGRNVVVTSSSSQDVWIAAFRRGAYADYADNTTSGVETFTFPSQAGVVYVVVLQGYGMVSGTYNVSMSITSP